MKPTLVATFCSLSTAFQSPNLNGNAVSPRASLEMVLGKDAVKFDLQTFGAPSYLKGKPVPPRKPAGPRPKDNLFRDKTGELRMWTEGPVGVKKGSPISPNDIGVTEPLGIWDPLQIIKDDAAKYRRWTAMEIKHGRLAMAGFLGAVTTMSGVRFPGYLSPSQDILFSDIPGSPLASWAAIPGEAWWQIVAFIAFLEVVIYVQRDDMPPGDVGGKFTWARVGKEGDAYYEKRDFKLNVERNNGRAAMLGMIGMMWTEYLTDGNPIYPLPYSN